MSAVKGASVSLYSLHPGLCVTDLVIQKQAASLMGHDSSFPALPTEVLDVVASYISADDQESLHAFCSVSRSWYSGGVEHLYRFPKITGRNFDLFIRSICPSVNLHVRQNGLADLIRVLDMSHLVYNGSKSLTARLLNRVKNKLEVFVAPTATFGVNCLAAIAKCEQLRELDLSLISQGTLLLHLLQHLQGLHRLRVLHLPRAKEPVQVILGSASQPKWPPKVEEIHLNGAISFRNVPYLICIPNSTTRLRIESFLFLPPSVLGTVFDHIGSHLRYLHIDRWSGVDPIRPLLSVIHEGCPKLTHLRIVVEHFFCIGTLDNPYKEQVPPYHRLDLFCEEYDPYSNDYSELLQVMVSLVYHEKLPNLRKLGIDRRLGWTGVSENEAQVSDLDQLLKALAREDENALIPEAEAGVVILG